MERKILDKIFFIRYVKYFICIYLFVVWFVLLVLLNVVGFVIVYIYGLLKNCEKMVGYKFFCVFMDWGDWGLKIWK